MAGAVIGKGGHNIQKLRTEVCSIEQTKKTNKSRAQSIAGSNLSLIFKFNLMLIISYPPKYLAADIRILFRQKMAIDFPLPIFYLPLFLIAHFISRRPQISSV
jgi:hypothetical protein